MVLLQNELILWTGEKHSGKTTSAANLVKIARTEGFNVAGVLAPSIYHNSKLVGFDVLVLHSETRSPLARINGEGIEMRRFTFIENGLKLGHIALSATATKSADLIIIDEFGPLELEGRGWRKNVDSLLASSNAVILLIVRRELLESVRQLYADVPSRMLAANELESIEKVISILKDHSEKRNDQA